MNKDEEFTNNCAQIRRDFRVGGEERVTDVINRLEVDQRQAFLNSLLGVFIHYLPHLSIDFQKGVVGIICGALDDPASFDLAGEIVLNKCVEMPLLDRESVYESFHFYLDAKKYPRTAEIMQAMACITTDGLDEAWISAIKSYAEDNFYVLFKKFKDAHQIVFAPKMGVTAILLQSIDQMSANKADEDLLTALPFLVRNLAHHLYDFFENENLQDVEEIRISLDLLRKQFHPRASETMATWMSINNRAFAKMAFDAKHLLVIDGPDLARTASFETPLTARWLQLFLYDATPAFANSALRGLRDALELAQNDAPLTAENIFELYRTIGDATNMKLVNAPSRSWYHVSGKTLTPEGFDEMKQFMQSVNRLKQIHADGPEMKMLHERPGPAGNKELVELKDPSYDDVKNIKFVVSIPKSTIRGIERVVEGLVSSFNEKLGKAQNLKEAEKLSLTISKQLAWLHPGLDGNGRVAQLVRHIALIKSQQHLRNSPSLVTPFDIIKMEGQSSNQAAGNALNVAKDLSRGFRSLSDYPLPPIGLTPADMSQLHNLYPSEFTGDQYRRGWRASEKPEHPIQLELECVDSRENQPFTAIFSHAAPELPKKIFKVSCDLLPLDLQTDLINAATNDQRFEISSDQIFITPFRSLDSPRELVTDLPGLITEHADEMRTRIGTTESLLKQMLESSNEMRFLIEGENPRLETNVKNIKHLQTKMVELARWPLSTTDEIENAKKQLDEISEAGKSVEADTEVLKGRNDLCRDIKHCMLWITVAIGFSPVTDSTREKLASWEKHLGQCITAVSESKDQEVAKVAERYLRSFRENEHESKMEPEIPGGTAARSGIPEDPFQTMRSSPSLPSYPPDLGVQQRKIEGAAQANSFEIRAFFEAPYSGIRYKGQADTVTYDLSSRSDKVLERTLVDSVKAKWMEDFKADDWEAVREFEHLVRDNVISRDVAATFAIEKLGKRTSFNARPYIEHNGKVFLEVEGGQPTKKGLVGVDAAFVPPLFPPDKSLRIKIEGGKLSINPPSSGRQAPRVTRS